MSAFPEARVHARDIHGVSLVDYQVHVDTRGLLWEAIHESDPFVERIRQVYLVVDPAPMTIRAFHAHRELHDWFHIAHGSALFCLVDGREDSPTYRRTEKVVLTARKPQLLVVPPGIYHGWMSLEPDTILVSMASHEYDHRQPDEHRVPPDHFDEEFGGNPWRIEAK